MDTKFRPENKIDHLEGVGIDERITLQWVLEKQGGNL
jgi:hypothetical protein